MSHPHWYLPHPWAVRFRAALGGAIDLDPAAARPELDAIHAGCAYLWPREDGLALPWFGRVYCNPPYDRVGVRDFASKAIREAANVDAMALLVPCMTSSRWWRDLARVADEIVFLPTRINFVDGSRAAVLASRRGEPVTTGTSGRQPLCVFGWRLADVAALGGIPVAGFMDRSSFRERGEQEHLYLGREAQP